MSLPAWPPSLSQPQLDHLLTLATSHALGHGFTLLPPSPTSPPTSAIPAPLSLLPTPFPRRLHREAIALQCAYNALYVEVARDTAFLDEVMGGSVARVDEFQGELWRAWKAVREELVQPLQLGLFRSDYLLHEGDGGTGIKQVEFNTISSSFGALSQLAGGLHRHLTAATSGYFGASPLLAPANYPENTSLASLAAGLAAGHRAYGIEGAKVLFVVQEGERNVFDQRWLEWELMERHGIPVVRHTFDELESLATLSLDASRKLLLPPSPLSPSPTEISVVYYRAGYTPADYTSSAAWATRTRIERSAAIKCPSLALQLAGAKKVQQVLAEPEMLERFARGASADEIARIRETFTDLYPLDDSPLGKEAYKLATDPSTCTRYVLKPQREGGGNNIYREAIPPFLAELERTPVATGDPARREGYILMSLIAPPTGVQNYLVKGGAKEAALGEVVSELGVYGVALFDGSAPPGEGITVNEQAGTLLRTKGRESDEGGVAVGYSVIDSAVLVD